MQNKAIAVSGVANTGKTTTIKRVYEQLKEKYDVTIVNTIRDGYDFTVIVKINGKLIGINSLGDPSTGLAERLEILVRAECEIIITATRSRGATVDAFEALEQQGYKLIRYHHEWKDSEDNQERRNNVHVDRILKHIAELVEVAERV